ncbi:MAG: alpha/beta hydrolase [Acidobacteriota bacterium]
MISARGDVRAGSLKTDGCARLHYTIRGSGEPILFLHGFPTSGMLWDETARILSGRYTCLCPDLPGWGESAPLAGQGAELLEASIPILEALEEACGRPVRWIASTDAGAVLAAYYAAVRPEKVERMVLMSAPLWPDFNVPGPMRILRTPLVGGVVSLLLKPLMFWRLGLESRYLHRYSEAHKESFSRPFRGLLGGTRLADRVRWGDPQEVMEPLSKLLPAIQARTLVVHCSDDLAVPESMARRSAEAIPDAQLLTLEGPHFIPLTHPELVARHLDEFFSQS